MSVAFPSRHLACIGSRILPPTALAWCRRIGAALAWAGWTVHTGGAPGADTAFAEWVAAAIQAGAPGHLVLHLPWPGFAAALRRHLEATISGQWVCDARPFPPEELAAAAARHPAGPRLAPATQRLLARDGRLLRPDPHGPPVARLIAWPAPLPHGRGTRYTIRWAQALGIPVDRLDVPAVQARYVARLRQAPPIISGGTP